MQVAETKNGKLYGGPRPDKGREEVRRRRQRHRAYQRRPCGQGDRPLRHAEISEEREDSSFWTAALEIEKTEVDAKIEITSPDQMQAFLQQEEKMMKDMVDKIAATKANSRFLPEGHRRRGAALPGQERHLSRPPREEERHGEARAGRPGANIASTLDDLKETIWASQAL